VKSTAIERLRSWWAVTGPKNVSKCLRVDWDDTSVRVRVMEKLAPDWNQEFQWADVVRVCFKDQGVFASDILFLEIRGQEKPAAILTEALRGTEFMAELVRRDLFPSEVFRKAIASAGGGLFCWPPNEGA
jgi:hypothetical protein